MFAREYKARNLPCGGQAEKPDGARGNNTVARATAPRHGDAVNRRVVTLSVEYRLAHRRFALGSLTTRSPALRRTLQCQLQRLVELSGKSSRSAAKTGCSSPSVGSGTRGVDKRVRRRRSGPPRLFAGLPVPFSLGAVAQAAFVEDAPQIDRHADEKLVGRSSGFDPGVHLADAPVVSGDRVGPSAVSPGEV